MHELESRLSALILIVLLAAPGAAPVASAEKQDSLVDTPMLEAAIAGQLAEEQSDRELILGLLRRAEVAEWADEAGLDLQRAEAAVSTLEGEELTRLAEMAATADAQLVGGQGGTPPATAGTGQFFPVLYGLVLVGLVLILVLT